MILHCNCASINILHINNDASLRYIAEQRDHFSQTQTQIYLFLEEKKKDELDLKGSLRLEHISRVQ